MTLRMFVSICFRSSSERSSTLKLLSTALPSITLLMSAPEDLPPLLPLPLPLLFSLRIIKGEVVVSSLSAADCSLWRELLARLLALLTLPPFRLVRILTRFEAAPCFAERTLTTGVFRRSCVVFFTTAEWTVIICLDRNDDLDSKGKKIFVIRI